jgi:3-oxoadipate enol-lactonase/4-carboxymuconolactone decarboxylase
MMSITKEMRRMFIACRDITIHVIIEGPPHAPPLVLLHSLGTSAHVWDEQAAALSRNFRVIRPDLRGHGLTSCTPGPGSMAQFAADLAALLDALNIEKAHIGGISIGGMIAQAFAAATPARTASLILCDTAMAIPPPENWLTRAATVRAQGIGAVEDAVIANWVTPGFIDNAATAGLRAMLTRTPVEGYAAGCEAIAAADLCASTPGLKIPTLIIVGDQDKPTPVAAAGTLHTAITGSSLVIIENAAHIPTVEKPAEITAAIANFLLPPVTNYHDSGMEIRKQVLGQAHVARASQNITDLDRDFQAFITRTAWGGVWARPGLDLPTRSLLTIALLAGLGHEEELKLHLRAARNTGATPADIAEALLHVAVYAGIPAANSAFRMAKDILKEPS